MALLQITLRTNESQAQLEDDALSGAGNPQRQAQKIKNYIKKLQAGSTHGQIDVNVSPVKASGTLTLDTVVENDTCVIAGVTLTAKDAPATNVQFEVGATDADTATSLAAIISAHPTLSLYVTAAAVGAVVTVTAVELGVASNLITLVGDTTITASAGTLAGGTLGTVRSSVFGEAAV